MTVGFGFVVGFEVWVGEFEHNDKNTDTDTDNDNAKQTILLVYTMKNWSSLTVKFLLLPKHGLLC